MSLSRRTFLSAAAATPLVAGASLPAAAGGHGATAHAAARSFILGDLHVTALLAGGPRSYDNPQGTFGMNVSAEEFAAVSEANFIAADKGVSYFTPTLVQDGTNTILFDTGLGSQGLLPALAEAGVEAADVTHVVITHMHPDHVLGIMTDGAPTFPNAVYLAGSVEFDFWNGQDEGNRVGDIVKSMVAPLAEKMTFVDDGASIAPGITSMATFGHTPGHMGYMLDSGGQQMFISADMTNHPVWSLAYPDWEVRFDADKEAAAATRRKVLGMLAADRIPMLGYHMPFPAAGYIETRDDGFRWVPVSYQFTG